MPTLKPGEGVNGMKLWHCTELISRDVGKEIVHHEGHKGEYDQRAKSVGKNHSPDYQHLQGKR